MPVLYIAAKCKCEGYGKMSNPPTFLEFIGLLACILTFIAATVGFFIWAGCVNKVLRWYIKDEWELIELKNWWKANKHKLRDDYKERQR